MKRKAIAIMLIFMMAWAVLSNAAGTLRHARAEDVWTPISNAAELDQIRSGLSGHYKLMQDIDLAGYDAGDGEGWQPIGTNGGEFTGSFDGNGFVIRNMTIDRPGDNNVGLFGTVMNATIANVHLMNVNVKGHTYVGGLAGVWERSWASASSVQGTVSGVDTVGGLVGYNSLSDISDSYMAGHVAAVSGSGDSFGGLIGYGTGNGARGSIARSYSTAAVDSGTNTGGLAGRVDGPVSDPSAYWDIETSGQSTSIKGAGKSTAQMLLKSTYSGWDFTGNGTDDPIWGMVEGATYPLHYGDYKKIALASLNVTDESDEPQELDRVFSGAYGAYSVRVGSETDQVKVSGTPLTAGSIVSVEGGTGVETLPLDPGVNVFEVQVSDAGDPAALKAVYKLTVNREDGSVQYPHRITSAEQLSRIGDASIGYELEDSYELEADLDLRAFSAAAGWEPIGSVTTPFEGVFEGNGHTIANVSVKRPGSDDQGLFGATSGATISHISIVNANITGADKVGGLIGRAENTDVSGVSVQGAVSGASDVGGLIGSADALTSLNESYAAAAVQADSGGGGLIGSGAAAGSVIHSFWDSERSGQAFSAGGGTPHSTADMMKQATYTGYGGSVWAFGSGKRWGIVEGTTYPMPYASFQGVSPAAIAVDALGTTLTMTPSVFNAATGTYAIALAAPVAQGTFTVTPAAGQTVSIDGVNGNTRQVDLSLGDKPVEITVTGSNGQVGVYRFTIAVPSPSAAVTSVPPGDIYGIGDELIFVVAYDFPVDVDSAAPPELPIELDSNAGLSASYVGMSGGDPRKLEFRYTIQEGDRAAAGIQLGEALVAPSTSSVTTIGSPVSLDLASPLPDTSGIVIDGELPEIELTPSTTAPVSGPVTIAVDTDGTGTNIAGVKWAAGSLEAADFGDPGVGTDVPSAGSFHVSANGTYTVYTVDTAGNERVEEIAIANIVSEAPGITLDYTPKTAVSDGVDITVSAAVAGDAAGNKIETLKWAAGSLEAADFGDPGVGTDVPSAGSFHVTANGTYTVYAVDTAGNERVEEIAIANIVSEAPSITLDYTPKTAVSDGVDITVSVAVADDAAGNKIEALKWAAGSLDAADFGDPDVGTDVPSSGSFHVSANGTYTVYAVDTAGNEQVEEIAIANIVSEAPSITLDYTPKTAVSNGVDITVSAAVADDAAGNKIEALKWAAGSLDAADFGDPDVGIDVPSSGSFQVSANGTYTVFAVDTAGNRKVQSVSIDNIIDPPVPPATPANPIVNQASFYLVPGREYTLTIDGLELFIPGDAIKQATTVTLKKVTDETKNLLQPGQLILSDVYELLKDTPGKFDAPVRLRLNLKNQSWAADQHPAFVYYDETNAKWTTIKGGKLSGNTMAGETDHFTKFAVMPVTDDPTSEQPIAVPSDIAGHWAEQEIADAVAKGIVSGYPDGTFRPNLPVTRAEFALLLNRVLALPGGNPANFADQDDIPAWAGDAVTAVAAAGIVSGYPDHSFRPGARLSRIETAALIARAARLPATNTQRTSFADDAAIAEWALPYINAAYEAGLVQGQSLNKFNPLAPITRAEAVVLLARLASLQ
ncbi:S-layer homology domain-containing protein [Cohnella sp. GCM10012308]|uniref:S-layer homology domain-containing protein n=1 Tax=Cohnella sp. GCM10012308 TaxID=3317329 RepID=UPI00360710F9